VVTGNCNFKTLFDFSYYFVLTRIYLHFFSYSGERFFILYKESKENRKVRNVRLVGNTDDSAPLNKNFLNYRKSLSAADKADFCQLTQIKRFV